MPCSIDSRNDDLHARYERAVLTTGTVLRLRTGPHAVVRSKSDLSKAELDGHALYYQLSGTTIVEQGRKSLHASAGDVSFVDIGRPTKLIYPSKHNESVCIGIPREFLESIVGGVPDFDGVASCEKRTPLANCLGLICHLMVSGDAEDLQYVHSACMSLLSVEFRYRATHNIGGANPLLREIVFQIDRDISDADLTPLYVAKKFGISVNYLHKLFAVTGTTFSAYVSNRRLDYIRKELMVGNREPLASLAYRWGFRDVGTFYRAFKSRFGCTPTRYRGGL